MPQTIHNDCLTVTVHEKGAELRSIRGETEYLWQGDPAVWADRAPTIFPYVARLYGGQYTANGKPYRLPIHGFAKNSLFTVADKRADSVTLALRDSEHTRAMYPWPFCFRVRYTLAGNRLTVFYIVENTGTDTMYFGLGGHPGFNVPLEDGLMFSDYHLRFGTVCMPHRVQFTPDCFVTGEAEPYPLTNGDTLRLRHDLFDDDAIVLRGMADTVTLQSDRGTRGVRVSCPDMPYLGIWHRPHTDAAYVCIEPWSSLPGRAGEMTEFVNHPDLISLDAGKTYETRWHIDILP